MLRLVCAAYTCLFSLGTAFSATDPDAGCLWLGTANASTVITHTGDQLSSETPLALTILVHVDDEGISRFLKSAIVLHSESEAGSPGSALLAGYSDEIVRRLQAATAEQLSMAERFVTATFDFPGSHIPMQGSVYPGQSVMLEISLSPLDDENPFNHRFHPDHDNRDGAGRALSSDDEVYAITRRIQMTWDDDPQPDGVIEGQYVEVVAGMTQQPVTVSGGVRLECISKVARFVE